jgi:hypothetical protein
LPVPRREISKPTWTSATTPAPTINPCGTYILAMSIPATGVAYPRGAAAGGALGCRARRAASGTAVRPTHSLRHFRRLSLPRPSRRLNLPPLHECRAASAATAYWHFHRESTHATDSDHGGRCRDRHPTIREFRRRGQNRHFSPRWRHATLSFFLRGPQKSQGNCGSCGPSSLIEGKNSDLKAAKSMIDGLYNSAAYKAAAIVELNSGTARRRSA